MSRSFVSSLPLPEFTLWKKLEQKRALLSFELELTARCNNNCTHCYINLPAQDRAAKESELDAKQIGQLADEAVSLGAFWCLITGGEPLLREDFFDIYPALKRKGLLVSVFTNATLIRKEHVELFKRFPPRDLEISVYGVTKETYERVSRKAGSFEAHMRGLRLLFEAGIKVRLKTMALRSNLSEMPDIAAFCRNWTKDYFRFDPFLNLRYDRNCSRNREIVAERLLADEVSALDRSDTERCGALKNGPGALKTLEPGCGTELICCGAGNGHFSLGSNGTFRLCSMLGHPACTYDLRAGSLRDAWNNFVPSVRAMRSERKEFLERCKVCRLHELCVWCPGHAYLETGQMDLPVEYFCEVAHARAKLVATPEG